MLTKVFALVWRFAVSHGIVGVAVGVTTLSTGCRVEVGHDDPWIYAEPEEDAPALDQPPRREDAPDRPAADEDEIERTPIDENGTESTPADEDEVDRTPADEIVTQVEDIPDVDLEVDLDEAPETQSGVLELAATLADKQFTLGDILSSSGIDPVTVAGQGSLRLCGFGRFVFAETSSVSLGDSSLSSSTTSFGTWAVVLDQAGRPQLELREEQRSDGEPRTQRLAVAVDGGGNVILGGRITQIADAAGERQRVQQALEAGRELVDQAVDVFGDKLITLFTEDDPAQVVAIAARAAVMRLCRNGAFACQQGLDEGLTSGPVIVNASGEWEMQFHPDAGALLVLRPQSGSDELFATIFQVGRNPDGSIVFVSIEQTDTGQPFIIDPDAEITDDPEGCR